MEILLTILTSLLPVLASILTVLGVALAKKLLDKWGIERSERVDAMIDKYVGIGVNTAEVAGRKYLEATNASLAGSEKKNKAIKVVLDELNQSGITGVAEELISARIESWLETKGHTPGKATPK